MMAGMSGQAAPQATVQPPVSGFRSRLNEAAEKYREYEQELQQQAQQGNISLGTAFWMRQPGIRALFSS
jgi:hypothetical protein